jgi:hypothetical protein
MDAAVYERLSCIEEEQRIRWGNNDRYNVPGLKNAEMRAKWAMRTKEEFESRMEEARMRRK